MMEESGDDANGDGTFEFVGEKEAVPPADPTQPKTGVPESGDKDVEPTTPLGQAEPIRSESQPRAVPPYLRAVATVPNPGLPVYSAPVQSPPLVMGEQPYAPLVGHPVQQGCAPAPLVYAPVVSPVQGYQPQPPVPAGNQSFAVTLPTDFDRTSAYATSASQEGGGVWGWFKGNEFLSKVAEKAKSSVDSMITTLDPGMKEYIYSGGDLDVLVASDDEISVAAVREAFQRVFGRASVTGTAAVPCNAAAQPVGFAAGLGAAEDRLACLRQAGRSARQPLLAVESILAELAPECWFELPCLVLRDDGAGISLRTFGQPTPVPSAIVAELQDGTPPDYPLRWSGFALGIGEVAGARLGVPRTQWHEVLGGISRSQLLCSAACTLATMYKAALNR